MPAQGTASTELTITFADPPGEFRFLDFTLTYPGGTQRFLHDQAPMFWDPDFEQDRNGDGILDYWSGPGGSAGMIDYKDPKSGKAAWPHRPYAEGRCAVIGYPAGPRLFLPGHLYRLRCYVKRGGPDVTPVILVGGQMAPVGPLDNINKWQLYELTMVSQRTGSPKKLIIPHLSSKGGKSSWWIDNFTIEDLGPAK